MASFAGLLRDGRDAVTEIPDDRWVKEYFLHPTPGTKGKTYTFAAGVLEDLWGFDPAVFGISPREAGQMDPQQRLMLQVAWEALEDAGLPPDGLRGQRVGVYVGCSAMANAARLSQDAAVTDAYLMTGNTLALVSNRISHVLDLRGPSMTVDTACSSSLVALRLAQDALGAGVVDVAVVGGVNALLDPFHYVGFSSARMLSPKGRCQPFSAAADGYVRAEGAVAFVLERREERQLAPRRAYAKLRAVETNTDGWTVNVALPSVEGQASLLRRVYARAGVHPDELLFVEAHGTGTLAGDPVEAQAIGTVLGQVRAHPLPIGSVKSNIGHLEPASGAAGLLKALVALEEGFFPGTLHLDEVNPAIPFGDLNLSVSGEPVALPTEGEVRFAGVSSFGFGGANAHAILERVPVPEAEPERMAAARAGSVMLLSAFAERSLLGALRAWSPLVAGARDAAEVVELSRQAAAFRGLHPKRVAVICGTPDETAAALQRAAAGLSDPRVERAESLLRDAPVAFVFSGNGSQFAGMGLAFLKADAAYARALRRIDRVFAGLSGWSIIDRMRSPGLETDLRDAAVAQPLLFADQIALVEALKARGLRPDAVMGHSGGEVAAACAAGILTLEQGLEVMLHRSLQAATTRGEGTMGAVQAAEGDVRAVIAEMGVDISIAAVNSPRSVTIVGDAAEVDAFLRHLRRALRWPAVRLAIDYPYHGRAMERLRAPLMRSLAGLCPAQGEVPFVSSVTGRVMAGADLDADYWCGNFCLPVDFIGAMRCLGEVGFRAFLEIGSQPVLQGYMTACLSDAEVQVLPSGEVAAGKDGMNPVDRLVARAMARGFRLRPSKGMTRPRGMRRDLPKYVWANEPFRIDRTPGILNRLGDARVVNPLLGREEGLEAGVWRSELDALIAPKLEDHRIGGKSIVPATAIWEILLAAVQARTGEGLLSLLDLDILSPIVLSRKTITEVQTRLDPVQGTATLGIRTRGQDGAMRLIAKARLTTAPAGEGEMDAPDHAVGPGDRDGVEIYASARRRGIDYGPHFARLRRFRLRGKDEAEVFLDEAGSVLKADTPFVLDVIGADAALHGLVGLLEHTRLERTGFGLLPQRLDRIDVMRAGGKVASARLRLRRMGERSLLADVVMFDRAGAPLVRLAGLRLQAVRLVRDVVPTLHGFRQVAVPVEPAAALGCDPAQAALEAARAERCAPQDDSVFLIEAAAHAVVAEALADLAGSGGALPDIETLPPYPAALAGMALRTGDAEVIDGRLHLRPIEPDRTERLIGLVAEALPDRAPDWIALMHLRRVLPGLLRQSLAGEDLPGAEAVLGRDALAGLSAEGILRRRIGAALQEATLRAVEARGAAAALRIAEVSDGRIAVLADLLPALTAERAQFTAIIVAGSDEAAGAGLPEDRVVTVGGDAASITAAGPFDLILSVGGLAAPGEPGAVVQALWAALAPGGVMMAAELPPSDLADVVHGLDPGWHGLVEKSGQGSAAPRLSRADLQGLAEHVGVADAEVLTLPDGCAGASLLCLRKPDGETAADVEGETVDQALCDLLRAGLCGEDDLVAALPAVGAKPPRIVAVLPRRMGDPVALMAGRILALRDMLEAAPEGARVVCVLPGGSGMGPGGDALQAGLWTFLRSAANEYPLLQLLRHDPAPELAPEEAALRIAVCEAGGWEESEILHDRAGTRVLRVMHGVMEAAATGLRSEGLRSVMRSSAGGGLDDLNWATSSRREPGAGEVEIAVEAVGLNYRDVMWTMGLLPEEALEKGFAGPTIGIECAGRVLRCGPDCGDLCPGDRVMTFGPGCMTSHLTISADLVAPLPEGMSAEGAATVPVAFFTAWYALDRLARLGAGDWVLIHGGAGGVGLAAIQIARKRGARIIATAGSAAKRSMLRTIGVDHVLDSRTLAFAETVRGLTGGRGVDVVVNSLAAEAMERSIGCLAPFGRFVELGKQDFYANTGLGLRPLRENVSYFAVDVDQLLADRPVEAREIFSGIMDEFAAGALSALPHRVFEGRDATAAFRLMQKSGHVGKIVLRPLPPERVGPRLAEVGEFVPRPDGFHLIVGGLGGLGLEVADFLVEAGARRIALMGRRAEPDAAAGEAIRRWRMKGCEVRLVACDVADAEAVAAALAGLRPLAGVIHSAMVLEDMPLAQIGAEVLDRVLPAKIAGAANLDKLTRQDDLDFFVLFTSMATLIGNHGQSAYVAANGFLEGIARSRRESGLPGLAVGWGGIGDVGYLARDHARAAMVRRMSGDVEFTGLQAVRALDRLLASGDAVAPVVHVSPMGWQAVAATLPTLSEPAFALFRRLGRRSDAGSGGEDLREALIGLPEERAVARMVAWLTSRIAHILQVSEKAVLPGKPVSELGIDSLMGVELGLTLQDALGADIPTTAVSDSFTIEEISLRIVRHLHGGVAGEASDALRAVMHHVEVAASGKRRPVIPPSSEAAE